MGTDFLYTTLETWKNAGNAVEEAILDAKLSFIW